jgi:hypothetical protein
MFKNKNQARSTDRGSVKSTSTAAAGVVSPQPTRQEAASLSDADIAAKAYEIWLAHGREMGNDWQHWFEAKRQLRQR